MDPLASNPDANRCSNQAIRIKVKVHKFSFSYHQFICSECLCCYKPSWPHEQLSIQQFQFGLLEGPWRYSIGLPKNQRRSITQLSFCGINFRSRVGLLPRICLTRVAIGNATAAGGCLHVHVGQHRRDTCYGSQRPEVCNWGGSTPLSVHKIHSRWVLPVVIWALALRGKNSNKTPD